MQEASDVVTLRSDLSSGGNVLVNKVLELLNVSPCTINVAVCTQSLSLS